MLDSDDEEDFAEYGTPLDPLDEDSLPRKKPFALEDQVVKDKQGRRRFHGAFTGGFSAGFFNSVGSLEGWTPSTFKSSRSVKADKKIQGPKDFMDDEDMEEHGIAPNVLRATSDFNDKRGTKRERPHQSDGPIPGKPVLQELLQPARDTVGIKLLKQMGWRPGQGVGPRQTRVEKQRSRRERRSAAGRVYGCTLPDSLRPLPPPSDDSSSESDTGDVTFAPDDLEPFLCKTKDNCFGIGYAGLDRRPVLSGHINLFEPSFLNMTEKDKKVSISGQAFGVGAFEEEDADIYAREDMSQYDFALEGTAARATNKDRKHRWSSTPGSEVDRLATCIEGFVIAPQAAARKKFFPPPTLPPDFRPVHVGRKTRFEPAPEKAGSVTSEGGAKRRGLGRHSLTADDRSHIIGEASSCPPPAEVKPQVTCSEVAQDMAVEYSDTPTATDASGNSRFRPFLSCPEKQRRYEQFLTLSKAEQKEGLSKLQPLSMTEWEGEHERMEFEQAARLYRPMSEIMSDRFVSATQADDATNPLAYVEKTRSEQDKELTQAAKMKMFGRLTRERTEWRPTSLLCKRFNIPEPFAGSSGLPSSEPRKKTSKFSVFDFLDAAQHNSSQLSPRKKEEERETETHPPETSSKQAETVPETGLTENAPSPIPAEGEPPMTSAAVVVEKAVDLDSPDSLEKVDLFKAIFLSSSDEDESDTEGEEAVGEKSTARTETSAITSIPADDGHVPVISAKKTPAETFHNTERNTSPARGIFANLDLDAVNARARQVSGSVEVSLEVKGETMADELSDDMFGPPMPSDLQVTSSNAHPQLLSVVDSPNTTDTSDGCWVEKPCKHPRKEKHSKKKSHKKDKKASKHKHKHTKHKKKHKR